MQNPKKDPLPEAVICPIISSKAGLPDPIKVKQLKEIIDKNESRLRKMMVEVEGLWEDTGLDPKDSSYLVEKTMRFELAQKNISSVFSSFKDMIDSYKRLCQELESVEE